MVCIYCGHDTKVTNSRPRARNPSVWRRRQCLHCVAQFSSEELPDYAAAISIIGQDGRLYPFSRDRLFLSLYKSLGHRKDALASATELSRTVIGRLLRRKAAENGAIPMQALAKAAHATLKRYDPLAAHTYKAYHQGALKD